MEKMVEVMQMLIDLTSNHFIVWARSGSLCFGETQSGVPVLESVPSAVMPASKQILLVLFTAHPQRWFLLSWFPSAYSVVLLTTFF